MPERIWSVAKTSCMRFTNSSHVPFEEARTNTVHFPCHPVFTSIKKISTHMMDIELFVDESLRQNERGIGNDIDIVERFATTDK